MSPNTRAAGPFRGGQGRAIGIGSAALITPSMPEVFAVLLVFVVAVFVYVMMWLQSRDPAHYKPEVEMRRMQQQGRWLEERLALAHRENWDAGLVAGIITQRDELSQQVAMAAKRAQRPQAEKPATGVAR